MPTIRPIPTTFVSCVAEREPAGHSYRKRSDTAPFGLFALWRAYRACRKGKRQTRDTQAYETRLLDNLVSTRDALASASWHPSPLLAFVVAEPKRREIHAAPFGDRVVHHLLVDRLATIYEPVFIHDSCANRKGKGTHFAVDRLQHFMRAGIAGKLAPTGQGTPKVVVGAALAAKKGDTSIAGKPIPPEPSTPKAVVGAALAAKTPQTAPEVRRGEFCRGGQTVDGLASRPVSADFFAGKPAPTQQSTPMVCVGAALAAKEADTGIAGKPPPTGHGTPELHALQLDIANFFNCIHRPTLFHLIQHRLVRAVRRQGLAREEARALQSHCRALLANDPTAGVRKKGTAASFASVPPHKRLSGQEPGRGLPIGNLTSQFFANVYLNELDQFVKHELKARHYVRYVDDFVLLHPDPQQLLVWRDAIETFLVERLGLVLKERAEPKPVAAGVDFLGYIVRPFYRLVRRRTVQRFHRVLAAFERRFVRDHTLGLPPPARDRLRAQIASYRAHLSHAHSVRLWQRSVARFPWLATLFAATDTAPGAAPLRPTWQPASVTGIASQYHYFTRRYPDARVLIEVGNRWLLPVEVPFFAGKLAPTEPSTPTDVVGASLAAKENALAANRGQGRSHKRKTGKKVGAGETAIRTANPAATTHYPGLGPCIEYRTADLPGLRQRWKRQGIAHVLVAQDGHFKTGFKRRVLRLLWRPASPVSPPSSAPLTPCRGVS